MWAHISNSKEETEEFSRKQSYYILFAYCFIHTLSCLLKAQDAQVVIRDIKDSVANNTDKIPALTELLISGHSG